MSGLRSVDEARQRQVIRALSADSYDIDMSAACHELMLGWDEIGALATDPLVTIGAQSKAHYEISKLAPEKALSEMEGSADIIEAARAPAGAFQLPLWRSRQRAGPRTSRSPRRLASRPR